MVGSSRHRGHPGGTRIPKADLEEIDDDNRALVTGIVAQGRTLAQRLDRVQRAAETVPQSLRAEADITTRRLSGLEDRIASLLTPAMRAVANATAGDDVGDDLDDLDDLDDEDDEDDADDDDDVDDDGAGDGEDEEGEDDENDADDGEDDDGEDDDGEDDDGEDDDNDSDDGKREELRDATVDDGDRAEPDDEDGEEPDTPEPASPAR